MKNFFLLFFIATFSCTSYNPKSLEGRYMGASKGYIDNTHVQYFLNLYPNNIFDLKIIGHDYKAQCNGVWKPKNNIIILNCNEENDIGVLLSNGYIKQKSYEVSIRNRSTLEFENILLNRLR